MLDLAIRKATKSDFPVLYKLGEETAEFRVSANEVFMDADEFSFGIVDPNSVFLVAETNNNIIGFIYASLLDHDKPLEKQSACLIYIMVLPEFRGQGIARQLYLKCESCLKELGAQGIYAWANTESDGAILKFMEKQGFAKGHKYIWMDKKL